MENTAVRIKKKVKNKGEFRVSTSVRLGEINVSNSPDSELRWKRVVHILLRKE